MNPATIRAAPRRRLGVLGVAAGLLLTVAAESASAAGARAAADELFERYEVITSSVERQTALAGFLLGGAIAELAVVSVHENDERRLAIYAFAGDSWARHLDSSLRSEVLFVDVANIGGQDRLITYEPGSPPGRGSRSGSFGSLNWFDPESATEHTLVAVASDLKPPSNGNIPHLDVTRDVNADGRDDLVVPDSDGFWVFIQTSGATFADPVKIGPPFEMEGTYAANGYRHDPWDQSRIHEMDYNRDGRSDLVFWNEDHFEVHHQDERGLLAAEAVTFTTDVAFASDDLATLAAPQGVRNRRKGHMPAGAMTGRVLHSLTDMNGDGVADLVVFSLKGGSPWRMHSSYEVYFGSPSPEGTEFAPDVGTAIQLDGILYAMKRHDLDQDGQVDMMFTTFGPGFVKAAGLLVRWFLTRRVPEALELYQMDGGLYPDKPSARRKIKVRPGDAQRRKQYPSVLIGDVNGDGFSELLVQQGQKKLGVFLGVPGPRLFSRQPRKVAVVMPHEEYTWLVDLDKDGKQDVLLHHSSTTHAHRVVILIAR